MEINSLTANGPSLADSDNFGSSVALVGDLNRDGTPEIVSGAASDGVGATIRGVVHVMSLDRKTTVQGVASTASDGTYGPGTSIDIDMRFSEPVITSDFSTLALETGNIDRQAAYSSGNGTSVLRFQYTIQPGDATPDLNYLSASSLAGNVRTLALPQADAVLNLPPPNLAVEVVPPKRYGPLALNSDIVVVGSDTTPPTITPQANVTREATAPHTSVTLQLPTVTDNLKATRDITISTNASGTIANVTAPVQEEFPVGVTHVQWNATDAAGNTATAYQNVTITDTTPPVIDTIHDYYVTGVPPIPVSYPQPPPAADLADGTVPVACSPVSGSTFLQEVTEVTCTAQDAAGNDAASVTFDVVIAPVPVVTQPVDSGLVYPVYMAKIDSSTPSGPSLVDEIFFGSSMAFIGDIDSDGVPDIVTGMRSVGAVHVILMNPDGTVKRTIEINGTSKTLRGPSLADGDAFGRSVAGIGDLDGDGTPDIAVGASGDDAGGIDRGAVYVMLMSPNGTIKRTIEINGTTKTPNGPDLVDRDTFGRSVAGIGDLNRDGVPDIATGASSDDTGGTNRGVVYIMLMNPDGTVKRTVEINGTSKTPNGPDLANFDFFGSSVALVGDLNGDGTPEIAVGAPGDDEGGSSTGVVHVMLMSPNGTVKDTIEINHLTTNGPSLAPSDFFGTSVTGIGDINSDGIPDIASGAEHGDGGGTNRGAVHIMLMNSDGTVGQTIKVDDSTFESLSLADFDNFGSSVVLVGDLDGDGTPEMAVGAHGDNTGGTDRGAVHLMSLTGPVPAANGMVHTTVEINGTTSTSTGPRLSNNDHFGVSISSIGDLDGDGTADLAAGAWGDDAGGTDRGALHIMLMNPGGTVRGTTEISSSTSNGPSLADNDHFGVSVSAVGDLNSDGVPDVAAGAPNDDAGGSNRGAVHVMLMRADGTVRQTVEINGTAETPNGPSLENSDMFGTSVAGIGDINSDGVPDIAAGAQTDDAGGTDRGAVHVMLMSPNGTVRQTVEINGTSRTPNGPSLGNHDRFGTSVAGIGDINSDGIPDIAAGAANDDGEGTDRGAVHVMLMSPNGTIRQTVEINGTSRTPNGPSLGDNDLFGSWVTGVGDLNGDGVPDIAAGARRDDAGGTDRGTVHVMLMNRDGTVKETFELNSLTTNGPRLSDGDFLGRSVTGIGDLNGDGVPDIVAGAPRDGGDGGTRLGAGRDVPHCRRHLYFGHHHRSRRAL